MLQAYLIHLLKAVEGDVLVELSATPAIHLQVNEARGKHSFLIGGTPLLKLNCLLGATILSRVTALYGCRG